MTNRLKGIHPRLVPCVPDPRPSLDMLSALQDVGEDFAWAVWYAVWRLRGDDAAGAAPPSAGGPPRFDAAFGCVPRLDEPLRTLADYLHGVGTRKDAADALLRISEWALERGAAEPAIQCAEAAAALVPDSPRRSLAAGRTNRFFSEAQRAAVYYERALTLARFGRKWRTYVRAHLGLGQAKKALGDPAAARAHFYTAARAARSLSGEKWLAAQTRHDLLVLATEQGAFHDAAQHARQALDWYPRHHASLPALAHDLAFLLVRMHEFSPALQLLRLTVPKLIPRDQVIAWSTLARAAAGYSEPGEYRDATENVLRLVGLFDLHGAAAFDNLAWGARALALWREAEQYASRSLDLASGRAQREVVENATQALAAAREHLPPEPAAKVDERLITQVRQLARDMAGALSSWRGATWKRKRQSGRERLGSV